MALKTGVYLDDASVKILNRLAPIGDDGNRPVGLSGRINQTIQRYDAIISRSMPEFTRDEWCAIFDANNPGLMDGDSTAMMIWPNVADTPGLSEKWDVDPKKLIARLRKLTTPELLAVGEACSLFWLHCDGGHNAALELAGCRVK